MGLHEKIDGDLKDALRAKDQIKLSTLRMLRAGMLNLAIDKKKEMLDDAEVIDTISKEIKQHRDSIEGFQKGNRQDLVDKEKAELAILESYMPAQLTREEVSAYVNEAIASLGALTNKDMGRVMKAVMEKVKGRAEGKLVSEIAAGLLSGHGGR